MKLFIAGASIMANYDITQYPLTGIGMALSLYLKHEIKIYNFGRPGRSTKTFIEQGYLAAIEKEIGAGDYMLIEFAHNDEKEFDDYLYTAPFGAYKENLKKMIAVARNAGATPILMTAPERRQFMDGSRMWADPTIPKETPYKLAPSAHTDYAEATKQVAQEEGVALIDMLTKTREAIEKAGPVETVKWYMNIAPGEYPAYPNGLLDNTHLKHEGAVVFAGLVAEGLKELGAPYADLLVDGIR